MRRFISFLLLSLVLGSLLPAVATPARAETAQYYALSFDGQDDYITAQGISSNELTVVALFKATNLTGEHSILDARKWGTLFGGWNLRIENGKLRFMVVWNDTGSYREASTDANISVGRTYLAAATFDGAEGRLYVNGQLSSSVTVSNPLISTPDPTLWIGIYRTGSSGYFEGTIYMILIYTRALSDSEIQAIYADPLNPPADGLVLEYLPSSVDTVNGLWKDLSGNGNDGSIVGASYVPLRPVSEAQFEARALRFNEAGYVELPELQLGHQVTFIAIAKRHSDDTRDPILSSALGNDNLVLWTFGNSQDWEQGYARLYFSSGSSSANSGVKLLAGSTYFLATSVDVDADTAVWYVNGDVTNSVSYQASNVTKQKYYLARWRGTYSNMTLYYFMIYNRILSDSEIQQIYENPLDPPKDGLVLFYSPYSYDPESGKWLNIAPIFPTIPLAEELDAVNYGATPERVSLLRFNVFDLVGNPVSSFTITDLNLNVSTSLPLFPVPYDLRLHRFNITSGPSWAVIATTPNSDKNLSVSLSGWVFEGEKPMGQAFAEGAESSLGSRMAAGIFALFVIVAILVAHKVHPAVGALALVPLLLAFAKYGYLPAWVGYGTLIVVGVLTVPVVVSVIGGENR